MAKDFAHLFEIIRNKFIEISSGQPITMKAFAVFLGHDHDGKVTAWKRGQWPSSDDIAVIHDKLGFNYRWLLTGEGEPFDAPAQTESERMDELEKEVCTLKAKLEETESELRQERRLNRQLTTKLLVEGTTNEESVAAIGKVADGQR